MGSDIGGIAVHAAARVMVLAGPSEVLVTSATVGLAERSGLRFEDAGRHDVKGLDARSRSIACSDDPARVARRPNQSPSVPRASQAASASSSSQNVPSRSKMPSAE